MLINVAYTWWPKNWHIFVRLITSSNIYQLSIFFTVRIMRKFEIILSLKIPPHLNCAATPLSSSRWGTDSDLRLEAVISRFQCERANDDLISADLLRVPAKKSLLFGQRAGCTWPTCEDRPRHRRDWYPAVLHTNTVPRWIYRAHAHKSLPLQNHQ